jgi:epoxyqueuosine reductase
MPSAADSHWIVEQAQAIGFDLCGIVGAEKFPELGHFNEWLARGYAGEMRYLADPRRGNPRLAMENLRSVIVCALNYNTRNPYSVEAAAPPPREPRGWVSRYAWGQDYHEVLWEMLNALSARLEARFPSRFSIRAYVDTGPVAERIFAKHAGLGWLGKNTLLLHEELGSWLFLGVTLTSLELVPTRQAAEGPPPDLCGNCRQCLDACPTGAIVEPYVLDARRCISYLTIELRRGIPEEFREPMAGHVFGCDICQDVCPFNRKAPFTRLQGFQPRPMAGGEMLLQPSLEWLAGLTEEQFRECFRGSAIKRTKWRGLVRNACIALGNAHILHNSERRPRILALLERLANSPEAVIAESARWALSRIEQKPNQRSRQEGL